MGVSLESQAAPQDYLAIFQWITVYLTRASCRRWVGFRIFARRSLPAHGDVAYPKDFFHFRIPRGVYTEQSECARQ